MAPRTLKGNLAHVAASSHDMPLIQVASSSKWRRAGSGADAAAAPSSTTTIYMGVGVGVGCLLLLAIIAVLIRIVYRRVQHRKAMARLDEERVLQEILQRRGVSQSCRPPMAQARRISFNCNTANPGWNALASSESIVQPDPIVMPAKRKRTSINFSRRFKKGGIPLKRLKALSAILESPQPEIPTTPVPGLPTSSTTALNAFTASMATLPVESAHRSEDQLQSKDDLHDIHDIDTDQITELRTPTEQVPTNPNPRAVRSISVDAFNVPALKKVALGHISWQIDNKSHTRSVSASLLATRVPSGPVPPLPSSAPARTNSVASLHYSVALSRKSSSSQDSTGSSILVSSPLFRSGILKRPAESPNLEEVVAGDEHASLRSGMHRRLRRDHVSESMMRAYPFNASGDDHHITKRKERRCDNRHELHRDLSISSLESDDSDSRRLPDAHIAVVDRVRMSRVSSSASDSRLGSAIRTVSTPKRRLSRKSSVSATGSPKERKRANVLEDISGNAAGRSRPVSFLREDSLMSIESGHSSNGNPFQWDTETYTATKPSAMKGSPNARKGHRRQPCVRISTLTPQVLGPQRSESPTPMGRIREEGETDGHIDLERNARLLNATDQRRPTRPTSLTSKSDLRVQILRASLTPSSPTLSAWAAMGDDNTVGVRSDPTHLMPGLQWSPSQRSSQCSSASAFSTSSARGKPSAAVVQKEWSVPEFCLSRCSTEDDRGNDTSSPFALQLSSETPTEPMDIPSSPPVYREMMEAKDREIDDDDEDFESRGTIGPSISEYDPASPAWEARSTSRLSPYSHTLARAKTISVVADENVDPESRVDANEWDENILSSSPAPEISIRDHYAGRYIANERSQGAQEKLTSENASTIMARIIPAVDFPGDNLPVLSPSTITHDMETDHSASVPPSPPPRSSQRPRAVSSQLRGGYVRHRSPPPTPLSTIPSEDSPPPPMPALPSSDDSPILTSCVPSPLLFSAPQFPPRTTSASATPQITPAHSPRQVSPSPSGPRNAPAQSVLRNAMALRRMNSEVATGMPVSREEKRYVRLGREASPLLPWIDAVCDGAPHSDSLASLFDFEFDTVPGSAAATDKEARGEPAAERTTDRDAEQSMDDHDHESEQEVSQHDLQTMLRELPPSQSLGIDRPTTPSMENVTPSKAKLTPTIHTPVAEFLDEERTLRRRFWEDVNRFARESSRASMRDLSKWNPKLSFIRAGTSSVKQMQQQQAEATELVQKMGKMDKEIQATPKSLYDQDGFLKA